MNREDILKAAQEDSQKEGEETIYFGRKGALLAAAITIFIILIMFLVEYIVFHKLDFGKPAIICIMSAVTDLYEGIKTKKTRKIVGGIIAFLIFVLCMILYIGAFF